MPFQLPTKEEKADYVLKQFDRIAAGYDLTNDAISLGMHRAWKERAVQQLCSGTGAKFLDVCCGTGDLALRISHHIATRNGAAVTGLDFSPNMLEVAARRLEQSHHGASKVEWIRGDAQNLPFANDTFDGAINSFGLRNLTDLQKGINEMARVVKPGARVINLDLGHSEIPVFRDLFSVFFGHVVPIIGSILQRDRNAYTYLPESLTTYPKPTEISNMFRVAGLSDVCHVPLAFGSVALHIGTKPGVV
ncbi:MAG TPA: bifunctional demethylmenaquinone methyltransferase/2-methoxy-6-polyprenyl-1,4-benzoquinol methylase UbiE [Oculatellaceae cyanobacterium]